MSDDDEEMHDYGSCYLCGGARYIVVCIDDICRNNGECIHGDGEKPCPNCQKP